MMRSDQLTRIDALTEEIADVFLTESDPKNWNGAGVPAAKMTEKVRGSRNWDVKNANQVGALLMRTLELRERMRGWSADQHKSPADDRADADIARYEAEAKKLLDTMGARRGKA